MPRAMRVCSAGNFSMTEAAAALPITPTTPGGWNPRKFSLAEATRMRPCTSKPVTKAVITSWPDRCRLSASARMPGKVGDVAWVAGCHMTS